jgi:hypothetical protein
MSNREKITLAYMADTSLGYRIFHQHTLVGHLLRSTSGRGWTIALSGASPFYVDCLLDEARQTAEKRYEQMWAGGRCSGGAALNLPVSQTVYFTNAF